jgi:hypothetical protein
MVTHPNTPITGPASMGRRLGHEVREFNRPFVDGRRWVKSRVMGITANYDRQNPLDELRRVAGADKRPAAILVTYDFDTNDNRDSPYKDELIKYLDKTLGGVMVTQSSYAVPYNTAVSDIIAKIGRITHQSITVYAFPFESWDGYGSATADEWFEKNNVPNIP